MIDFICFIVSMAVILTGRIRTKNKGSKYI